MSADALSVVANPEEVRISEDRQRVSFSAPVVEEYLPPGCAIG
jgi:hypothetical protein